jgi:hypothetical protein
VTVDQYIQDLLSPPEASSYLSQRWGLKRAVRTLQSYRRNGTGPEFHRTGNDVRYSKHAVDAWAAQLLGEPLRNTAERSARRLMAAAAANEG